MLSDCSMQLSICDSCNVPNVDSEVEEFQLHLCGCKSNQRNSQYVCPPRWRKGKKRPHSCLSIAHSLKCLSRMWQYEVAAFWTIGDEPVTKKKLVLIFIWSRLQLFVLQQLVDDPRNRAHIYSVEQTLKCKGKGAQTSPCSLFI